MRTVVQAGGGEERMVAQKSVPAWRTAQIAEKFGINAAAFKAAFFFGGISRPVPETLQDRASR
jgi:hypothetical protein